MDLVKAVITTVALLAPRLFIYGREGEGFLVYSLGADLEDDGGKVEEDGEKGDIVWRCAK